VADTPRRLAGDTFVFESVTNSGYTNGVLIDTGPDAEAYEGLPVMHLLITHGHADHFSCAGDLRRAGARVTAPREEASLVENPEVIASRTARRVTPGPRAIRGPRPRYPRAPHPLSG